MEWGTVSAANMMGMVFTLAAAFLLHFIVDFVTVVTAGTGLPVWAVEIEIMVIMAIIAYFIVRIYNKSVDNAANS